VITAEVLVEFTRGGLVEAVHRGHISVVDVAGELLAWVGDADHFTYMRSAAKPFQVLPLLEDRLDKRFAFEEDELAVMAGSHSGEERHVRVVGRLLERIGLDESALLCGVHQPLGASAREQLRLSGKQPGPLHNNCSGKHGAMLAQAVAAGYPLEDYTQAEHPVQRLILAVVREMTGVQELVIGEDGCGVPIVGLSIRAMAHSWARLIDPRELSPQRAEACRRVVAAMRNHPGIAYGEGRLGEALLSATGGQLLGKGGGEGLYAVGIPPSKSPVGRGLGLIIKMEDGAAGSRARRPALLEALTQLGVLELEERAALATFDFGPVHNHLGRPVGESRPAFHLRRPT
jgi:L-asparaginase II